MEPKLEYVRLSPGKSLHEPGDRLKYVYFPTSGIVALLHVAASGASAQLRIVGREGMVGLSSLLGSESAATRAVVQAAGAAYRLRTIEARAAFAEGKRFQAAVLSFAQAVLLELSQTAVCNLHHLVEQQLCRWLLVWMDRSQDATIDMTHELIASLLGVRRQGITEAAKKLQERNIVSYSRGRITVLDRTALEAAACECYRLLNNLPAKLSGKASGNRPVTPLEAG